MRAKCIFDISGELKNRGRQLFFIPFSLFLTNTRYSEEMGTSPRVKGSLDRIGQATALMASLVITFIIIRERLLYKKLSKSSHYQKGGGGLVDLRWCTETYLI